MDGCWRDCLGGLPEFTPVPEDGSREDGIHEVQACRPRLRQTNAVAAVTSVRSRAEVIDVGMQDGDFGD